MKQYSFGTFLVDDANRTAYEVCLDIANLHEVEPMPVLLLGDKGSGKTHLLYSIVNRVRAASADTGIAFITARNFHPRVRGLVNDPTPVQQAQSAVLLVDQLESFQEHLADLEAVVRLFLDYGHPVVFATDVHPGRLRQLPEGLQTLLGTGRLVEIVHGESDIPSAAARASEADETIIRGLQAEIASLRAQLAQAQQPPRHDANGTARLTPEEHEQRERLIAQLSDAKRTSEAAQAQADAAHEELIHLNAELALLRASDKEARTLRASLEKTQRELETLKAKQAEERAAIKRPEHVQEMEALRAQLSVAQNTAEQAKGEAEDLRHALHEAEERRAELESLRTEAETARQEANAAREELAKVQEQAQALSVLEAEVEALRAALVTVSEEGAAAQDEVTRLKAAVKSAEAKSATHRSELEAARQAEATARDEAAKLLVQAESLLAEVESGRKEFARVQDDQRKQVAQLEAMLAENSVDKNKDALAAAQAKAAEATERLNALKAQFEAERRALEQSHAEALAKLERKLTDAAAARKSALDERDRLARELKDVRAEHTALQAEVKRLAQQVREFDGRELARHEEEASRLAEARAETREVEHRLTRLQADLDFARDSGQYVGSELTSVQRTLIESARLIETLSGRLAASMGDVPPQKQPISRDDIVEDDVAFPAGFAVAGDMEDDFLEDDEFEAGFDLGQFEVSPQDYDRLSQPFTPLNPRDLEVPSSLSERARDYRPFREQV